MKKIIKMTAVEKEQIRNHLRQLVMATPESAPSFIQLIRSPFYSFHFSRVRVAVLSAFLIFAVSAGVSLAASGTLPGDSLYPIKTGVNEKVAGLLIFNTKAQASYETKIAFRRLEEAEELGAMGKLDDSKKTELESDFTEHLNKAQGHISAVASTDSSGAEEVESDFQSGLEAHHNILLKLAAKVGDGGEVHLNKLAEKLDELPKMRRTKQTNVVLKLDGQGSSEEQKVKSLETKIENNLSGIVNVQTGQSVEWSSPASTSSPEEDNKGEETSSDEDHQGKSHSRFDTSIDIQTSSHNSVQIPPGH